MRNQGLQQEDRKYPRRRRGWFQQYHKVLPSFQLLQQKRAGGEQDCSQRQCAPPFSTCSLPASRFFCQGVRSYQLSTQRKQASSVCGSQRRGGISVSDAESDPVPPFLFPARLALGGEGWSGSSLRSHTALMRSHRKAGGFRCEPGLGTAGLSRRTSTLRSRLFKLAAVGAFRIERRGALSRAPPAFPLRLLNPGRTSQFGSSR
mmetsp:Transcript_13635/g.26854  ORF Transcript_13635/g.26854 Transcript_13635/m.26854 type:complete len:204 (+) Transcript_13635:324-935(+)